MSSGDMVTAEAGVSDTPQPENIVTSHASSPSVHRSIAHRRARPLAGLMRNAKRWLSKATARPPGTTRKVKRMKQPSHSNSPQAAVHTECINEDGADPQHALHRYDPVPLGKGDLPGSDDVHSDSESSNHDDVWHKNYEAHADQYKELIREVVAMKSTSEANNFPRHPVATRALQGRGKVYHCYGHDGGQLLIFAVGARKLDTLTWL